VADGGCGDGVGWWLELRNRGPENAKLREEIKQAESAANDKYNQLVKKYNFEVQLHRDSIKLFTDTNRMLEAEAKTSREYAESVRKKYYGQ